MAEGDREDDTVLSNAADCRRSSHVDRHVSSRVCTVPLVNKRRWKFDQKWTRQRGLKTLRDSCVSMLAA